MSDYIPTKGFIYLLKICDLDNNKIIYKVGKSINIAKRLKKYNFPTILHIATSDDITTDEYEIIKLFKINCKLYEGREFFTSEDETFVLKLFINYFNNKINKIYEANKITNIVNDLLINVVNDVVNNLVSIDIIKEVVRNEIVGNNVVSNNVVSNEGGNEIVNEVSNDIVIDNIISENVDSSNDNSNDNSNTIESIENRKILERTCPTCKNIFNFASRLRVHLETTIHCKKSPEEITKFFKPFEKQSNFKCNICCSKYTHMQNLQRHIQTTDCKKYIKQNKLLNEIENMKKEIIKLNINN
jgi:hypothetical protein